MLRSLAPFLSLALLAQPTPYQKAPKAIQAVLDGPGTPTLIASPRGDRFLLAEYDRHPTIQDLAQRREVYDLIRNEIAKICKRFPENIRIKRFAILLKALHPDDGELTRTRKVRRAFVNERYQALIEDLYRATDRHNLDIEIRYEDGRISTFKGIIALEEISE